MQKPPLRSFLQDPPDRSVEWEFEQKEVAKSVDATSVSLARVPAILQSIP
jgi:hypothetical protein